MTTMTTLPYSDVFSTGLVHRFLEESARRFPEKIAVVQDEVRVSYAWLNDRANRLAHWMIEQGVSTGDRVAILFENGPEYIVSYYASLKAGAVAVPLSSDLKPHGLEPILNELEPRAVLCSKRFERTLNALAPDISPSILLIVQEPRLSWPKSLSVFELKDVLQQHSNENLDLPVDASELASIIYTSGSTGTPKGAMLSHGNIAANAESICTCLSIRETDVQMVVIPFFYVMGKSLLNTHMAAGATLMINNKFAFPADVIKQMETEQATAFSGVPSTYAYLLHRSPLKKYRDRLPHLRYCSQAGGHMATQIKKELRQALPPHTDIYIMYGATEAAARLTYLEPCHYESKMGSIGKAIPGVTIRIMRKDGPEASIGEPGELMASGPNIFMGYWKDYASTRLVLDELGYHTGDIGYEDPDGFFYLTGRKDQMVKVGGRRINPQEIEDALLATGLVVEAAVIGIPDELLGNKLAAIVVSKNGKSDNNSILESCSRKIPRYKMPAALYVVRSLPKTASGKIDKKNCFSLIDA